MTFPASRAPVSDRLLQGLPCRVAGEGDPAFFLVTAPPFSACLFDEVASRLGLNAAVVAPDLFGTHSRNEGFDSLVEALQRLVQTAPEGSVLLGHGLAVPLVRAVAEQVPSLLLVLTNGPLVRLDRFSAVLAALARRPSGVSLAARTLLQPSFFTTWMASSLGLRRCAVNPYVMDRSTVSRWISTWSDLPDRRSFLRYLGDLTPARVDRGALAAGTRLLWAEADLLYPSTEVEQLRQRGNPGIHVTVPGARMGFPEETPWILADFLTTLAPPKAT
jgi:hypothetical protein